MPLIISPGQLTQRAQFYQQFGQLLAAGISVLNALELLAQNPPNRTFVQPTRELIKQISNGANITDAVRHLGKWLPEFDIALIQAGEHSGRLDAVFRMLSDFYNDRAAMLRNMIADMMYPAFVLHMAVFIFPMIGLFNGGTMTGFLLRTFGVLIPLYILVFFFIFIMQSRHGLKWRDWLERVLRNVPILGKARHALALARLSAALEALTNAGVTLIEAWQMAAAASGSSQIQKAVLSWKPKLMAGQTPAEAVRGCPLLFPEMFANFYATAEVSGQLDATFKRLYMIYHEEGTRKMRFLAQWVPRFLYLCIALYIAYRVVSFYLGYFNTLNQIMK